MTLTSDLPITLLAIDDDPQCLELISEVLGNDGLQIYTAGTPEDGLDLVSRLRPQIVLLDLMLPRLSGIEVLERIMQIDPGIDVVLMTAHYSTESAVEAIKKGACDYMNKPLAIQALRRKVGELAAAARKRQFAQQMDSDLLAASQFQQMVGRSPLMSEMFAVIRRVAPHFRDCLITGATGTGKELVARALHQVSPAASMPFVVCNCSAVVETLFESELFGHVKGAFTGATSDKVGLFEYAHGGTLFLDEIGDMPLSTQAKLLRVLQNREVQRVGSLTSSRTVDVRVVAATNHDLRERIAQKQFREDLFYRLSMVEIHTPRLAERPEDLPLLERYFMQQFAAQYRKPIRGITQRAQIVLARYGWPGNVRELQNVIGHACMMAVADKIDIHDLPEYLRSPASHPAEGKPPLEAPAAQETAGTPGDGVSLDERERRLLANALEKTSGNQAQAARLLGITRDRLRYKMKKFQLV